MTIETARAVFEFFTDYAVGATAAVAAGVIAWRFRKQFRPSKAQRRHKRNQARSYLDLAKVREIGPIENPGRVFSWLKKVDPYRFEEIILSELDRRKLKIVRNESYSGDGGVDGRFYLNGELWLVQAKRYTGMIKEAHVLEFDQVCAKHNAQGLFVHTGQTPKNLRSLKRQFGVVRIISGDELMAFFAGRPVKLSLKDPMAQPRRPGDDCTASDPISRGRPANVGAWTPSATDAEVPA